MHGSLISPSIAEEPLWFRLSCTEPRPGWPLYLDGLAWEWEANASFLDYAIHGSRATARVADLPGWWLLYRGGLHAQLDSGRFLV